MNEDQTLGYMVGDDVVPPDQPIYILPVTPVVDQSEDWQFDGIETFALSPVNPSDTSGLKKILLEVLGPYDNVVTQYRYIADGSTRYTYVNEITPDYPWIFSAILFIVLIVSLFRMVRSTLWRQ